MTEDPGLASPISIDLVLHNAVGAPPLPMRPLDVRTDCVVGADDVADAAVALASGTVEHAFKVSPVGSTCSEVSPLLSDAFNAPQRNGIVTASSDYFGSDGISPCSSVFYSPDGSTRPPSGEEATHHSLYSSNGGSSSSSASSGNAGADYFAQSSSMTSAPGLVINGTACTAAIPSLFSPVPRHDVAFSHFSPPLMIGTAHRGLSSGSPSPNFGYTNNTDAYLGPPPPHFEPLFTGDAAAFASGTGFAASGYYSGSGYACEGLSVGSGRAAGGTCFDEDVFAQQKPCVDLMSLKSELIEGMNDESESANLTPDQHRNGSKTTPHKRRKSPHRLSQHDAGGASKRSRIDCRHMSDDDYDSGDNDTTTAPLYNSSTDASSKKSSSCVLYPDDDIGMDDDDFCERSATSSSVSSLSGSIDGRKSLDTIVNDKLMPLMPLKTRSKMHDLAVKHRLITNQNTRGQGVIQLSAEEKRTLLQEGYRLPTRLPLTRDEEEALKIVRRKIKNKLSAQESRRKRKEYIDTLEKKVQALYSDNLQLRSRVKQLDSLNRELTTQLNKFQQPQIH